MRIGPIVSVAVAVLTASCPAPRSSYRLWSGDSVDDIDRVREVLRDEGLDFRLVQSEGPAGARIEHWVYGTAHVLLHHVPYTPAFVAQRWWFGGPPSPRATESALGGNMRPELEEGTIAEVFFADDLAYAQLFSPLTEKTDIGSLLFAWLDALPMGPDGPLILTAVGGIPRTILLEVAAQKAEELAYETPDLPTSTTRPLDALSVQRVLSAKDRAYATHLEALAEVLGDPREGPLTRRLADSGARWVEVETRTGPGDTELTVRFGPLHSVSSTIAEASVTRALAVVARGDISRQAVRSAVRRLLSRRSARWARAEGRARMMAEALWTYGHIGILAEHEATASTLGENDLRAAAKRLLAVPAKVRP